ncbi:MAG: hypothetical protein M1820_003297 [Bogoriella megaspora]|nr:MAG: hypothetical protein M1820_003297 [Bogoriella megaspora]
MPKILSRRCDETLPKCRNCSKKNRTCRHQEEWPPAQNPPSSQGWNMRTWSDVFECDFSGVSLPSTSDSAPQRSQSRAKNLAGDESASSTYPIPEDESSRQVTLSEQAIAHGGRDSLRDPVITELFRHYVDNLASWFDLNDPQSLFADVIPFKALDNPILFKAIIAFTAGHRNRTSKFPHVEVVKIHNACLKDLIPALQSFNPSQQADYLAATCLLRSYEILNGGPKMQEHLFGAPSLPISASIDLTTWGLAQAAFWNYLRQDITIALESQHPLHIPIRTSDSTPTNMTGQPHDNSNTITFLLAKAINLHFRPSHSPHEDSDQWHTLNSELSTFQSHLPSTFTPLPRPSPNPSSLFPPLPLLRPYQISTLQYLHTTLLLLALSSPTPAPDLASTLESHALHTIGLSASNPCIAAKVNAFGPLIFCGRYLRSVEQREALRELLARMAEETGWNVEGRLRELSRGWGEREREERNWELGADGRVMNIITFRPEVMRRRGRV